VAKFKGKFTSNAMIPDFPSPIKDDKADQRRYIETMERGSALSLAASTAATEDGTYQKGMATK
jgi:hypothetical protein